MAGTVYVCMPTTPNGSTYRLETNDYSYGSIIKSCQEVLLQALSSRT